MKKTLMIIIAAALVCLVAGFCFFQANYVMVNWNIISRDVTQADLQGKNISHPEPLAELTGLVQLNLRNTGITVEQYEHLKQALPGCEIAWSVPFQGQYFANDITSLQAADMTQADVALLAYFPNLAQLDATDCTDLTVIQAVRDTYPQLAVKYWVPLGSSTFSQDTTALILGDGTSAELAEALSYLPGIKDVDASGCRDYAGLQALQAQYPQCNIRYTVAIGSQEVADTATSVTVQDPELSVLEAILPYLPQLETVEFTGTLPANEEIHKLQVARPDIRFVWTFPLCGLDVSTLDTIIDLSNIPMENTQEVESALPYFYDLERVIMCDCGISNEDMDALGQRNPDIRFVWAVDLGPRIHVRTDITALMPYQYTGDFTDADAKNLKYCIDLVCLDLGHYPISDVSFLAYMPHMKYLVIAISNVKDISPLAGHQELEYLEVFATQVQDYSPLLTCPNLRDLNICYAVPKDGSVLFQLTQLENLYMKQWPKPDYLEDLMAALPNVHIVCDFDDGDSSTSSGWRKLPRYFEMRNLLGMFYMEG